MRKLMLLCCGLLILGGCGDNLETGDQAPLPATLAGGSHPTGAIAVTHGGVGSPPEWSSRTRFAADNAINAFRFGGSALDAAVAGTVTMENIAVFNAGTGANIRLDGKTIQMDAAVMTSDGAFAAVAVIENVMNPILVAREVMKTPHRMLAGDGATRFAHAMGFEDRIPTCEEAEEKYRKRIAKLLRGEAGGGYDEFDWQRAWNFPGPAPAAPPAGAQRDEHTKGDTVGTVTRDQTGGFAVTLSTGGTSITLDGRVGDVPIYGCGAYAGPAGAVACTGHGEEIIRRTMARTVYAMLEQGVPAREAVRRGCAAFPDEWSLGLIAVDGQGWGVAANRSMAYGMSSQ
jgi:L-asparaginase / beta-aspartyl-peptidase